jgi:hypothetical protein
VKAVLKMLAYNFKIAIITGEHGTKGKSERATKNKLVIKSQVIVLLIKT